VVDVIRGRRDRPDAKTYAGSGKVDEIRASLQEHDAKIVVFDQALSAAQVRNLERRDRRARPTCASSTAPT
jgi:GTP-binding protein HflX